MEKGNSVCIGRLLGDLDDLSKLLIAEDTMLENASELCAGRETPPTTIIVGDNCDVVVSFVESTEIFYSQPLFFERALRQLQIAMFVYYSSQLADYEKELRRSGSAVRRLLPKLPKTILSTKLVRTALAKTTTADEETSTSKKLFCAVKHKDGSFYRGKILSRTTPSEVEVYFLDYGDKTVVQFMNLFSLPNEFRKLLPVAVKCQFPKGVLKEKSLKSFRQKWEGANWLLQIEENREACSSVENCADLPPVPTTVIHLMNENNEEIDIVDVLKEL